MSKESELLAILDDLSERVQAANEFEVLGIAGLLQKLLYGDLPLLEAMTRIYHLDLHFNVNNFAPVGVESMSFWTLGAAYFPADAPAKSRVNMQLGKNQFLCHRAMVVNCARYTVMDILRTVAMITAPLHLGVNRSMYEQARSKLDQALFGGHWETGLCLLKAFAEVVLEAADPLRKKLKAEL